ncbi:hypothetical protein D3C71_1678070 [compost metagenome]
MRHRPIDRLDEVRSESAAREQLQDVRAKLKGLLHFTQRQRPRHVGYAVQVADFGCLFIKGGADYKLGSGKDRDAGCNRVQNRSCSDNRLVPVSCNELLDGDVRFRSREGYLDIVQSAFNTGFGHTVGILCIVRANDGHDAGGQKVLQHLKLFHGLYAS